MKYCMKCRRSYTPTHSFCLEDGEALVLKDLYGLTGRVIADKYQIETLTAVGGMSAVYRAHQIGVKRTVAFKILLPNIAVNNSQMLSLFEREAQLAGRLAHENIATIHDAGQTEDQIAYIVMEWLEGHTLESELQPKQGLSYQRCAYLLHQIAAALDSAHDQKIIHRDLKPNNIMINKRSDGRDWVKVFDFGLAKVISESTDIMVSSALGTPHYASPEQFRTGEEISGSADLYALGVILYRMLTGHFPFNGANVHELIRAHLLDTPPPLTKFRTDVPLEVENLLNRMLAKTPHYRPARASEVAATFEQAVRNLPTFTQSGAFTAPELGHSSNGQTKTTSQVFTPLPGWSASGQHNPITNSLHTPTTPTNLSGEIKSMNQTPASFHATPTGVTSVTSSLSGYTSTSVSVNPAAPRTSPNLQAPPADALAQSGALPKLAALKNSKLFWGVVAAVLLLIASTGVYFFRRAPKLTERDTILLADLVNATGDDVFDRTLKQALSVQLSQSPFLNLLPDEKIRETLRFMNRKSDERLTREIAREISLRQGLKAMITGQIDKLDRHYSITLEAINSQTGEALTRTLAEANGKDQVLKALGQAATELRSALGESLGSIQKFNAPVDQATTSSLEALKAYSLGRDQYALRDNYTEGIALYKRAIELDPNFALAYNGLGVIYMNLGQAESSAENAELAYRLRDRVSERERLAITSFYYLIGGEVEKAIETYRLTVQTYPRQVSPHVNLSVCFNRLGQLEAAYAELQEAIKLDPSNGTAYQNGADLLVRLGRYEEALRLIGEAQGKKLDRLGYHTTLYQIGFIKGDHMLMHKQVEWTKGKTDEFRGYEWQAQTAAFGGKLRAADDFIRRALEITKQRNLTEVSAALMMNHALRLALAGKSGNAQALLDEAIKLSPNSFALYSVSKAAPFGPLMLALSGDVQRAKEFDEEMVKRQPRNTLANAIWLPLARAASELRHQRPAKALELLHSVSHYESGAFFYPAWLRGQAYLQLKQGREAAAEFEKILAHRGYEASSLLYPLAELELGRALLLMGDQAKAREHYQKFLTLWKEADTDLPVLSVAKKEYAKLK